LLREAALAVPISVDSACMPEADAIRAIDNTRSPFSGNEISVPLTVAFGARDWILTKRARLRDKLPAHTRWIEMRGLGHVPMWIDPIGISRLILEGAQ